jgi:aminocarboxymuconate-semialdehyde decarboxylase
LKINIHSHVVPKGINGMAGHYGPDVSVDDQGVLVIKFGGSTFRADRVQRDIPEGEQPDYWTLLSDPRIRIEEMDEAGIDIIGVSGTPLLYVYQIEAPIAHKFLACYNDCLAEYCAHAPDRLFFTSMLPLQDADLAVKEAHRTFGELGARGLNIGAGDIAGRDLDDRSLWPVYQAAVDHDVPLFVHPAPTPFVHGTEERHRESIILGYPYQESSAFLHLILGGVFDEFPDLKVYLTHGGGFVPYQLGRIEIMSQIAFDRKNQRPVRDYLDNFFFDLLIHDIKARQFAVDAVGAERLVIGDNYKGMDSADGFAYLDELDLTPEQDELIRWRNASNLFKLDALRAPK